ncbi:MAG: DUF3800 domain-containing protein [Thiotrichales bacterium]
MCRLRTASSAQLSAHLKNKLNHKKNSSRKVQELKGTQTTLPIKKYFFRQLPSTGLKIYSVVLNKNRVYDDLRLPAAKKKLYNYLARLVLEKVGIPDHTSQISLVVDRCKNHAEIKDFYQYLENEFRHRIPKEAILRIDHQSSHESKGLQAVDLFCWGIARKHEKSDTAWYAIYEDWISYETVFLRDK